MNDEKTGARPPAGGALPAANLKTERPRGAAAPESGLSPPNLGDDILRGADQIAEFLLGDGRQRRKVYHLAENSRLPVFKLGAILCARRSTLIAWIADQEMKAVADGCA